MEQKQDILIGPTFASIKHNKYGAEAGHIDRT